MTDTAAAQASLEAELKDEIVHGREAAELFGYAPQWLDRAPASAVAAFAGVGNPHERSDLQPGETVLDLGSGAGLDAIIASWCVGPSGKVIGVDLNPAMCLKAQAHAAATGARMECQVGRAELSRGLRRQGRHDDRAKATWGQGTGTTRGFDATTLRLSPWGLVVLVTPRAPAGQSPRSN